ncbi:MAG: NapC/NirT family cytochrome c [Pseudomonadota bacterium]
MWKKILSSFPRFWTNWLTLLGTAITTVAACTILMVMAASVVSDQTHPYAFVLGFLVMPAIFVGGLAIVGLGFLWERRRVRLGGVEDPIQAAFRAAFENKRSRRLFLLVGFATLINIVIVGSAGHEALTYMDSPEFCGTLCHSVMQPEYDTYLESPHSRIKCVVCHIGPGASWAVKSKIDGMKQVWGVLTNNHARPIPSPVHTLRPARDTCEQCHWPAKFHGNRAAVRVHYANDEENSPQVAALMLRVGGKDPRTDKFHGIHWHVSDNVRIEYEALDEKRERIGKVRVYRGDDLSAEYLPPEGVSGEVQEVRTMDCVDCHNRPTHVFDPNPERAADRAISEGLLDRKTPFIHKIAAQVLAAANNTQREGSEAVFRDAIAKIYATEHAALEISDEALDAAAAGVSALYLRNIYPALKLDWGTHPNHLGHQGEEKDLRGCFRCHNGERTTTDGKSITMDCDLCHEILSEDDAPEDLPDSFKGMIPSW